MESWQNIIFLDKVNSTNQYLSKLLKDSKLAEGSIVSTTYQETGKGQGNNAWESEKGKNLLVSMVLYPAFLPIDKNFLLSKIISLALIDYLLEETKDIKIKWPNDIYYKDKKIAGILIENIIKGSNINQSIVGIGLNLNQSDFTSDAPNPVSLSQITGKNYLIEEEIIKLRNFIRAHYQKLMLNKYPEINKEYLKFLYRFNSYHQYQANNQYFTAKITGVNEFGYLQLDTKAKEKIEFDFKEVEFVI